LNIDFVSAESADGPKAIVTAIDSDKKKDPAVEKEAKASREPSRDRKSSGADTIKRFAITVAFTFSLGRHISP
jgi:hypothetical protein